MSADQPTGTTPEQPVADVGSTPTSPVTAGVTVTSELIGELRAS